MKACLIVDDHEVTRRGLRELLLDAYPDLALGEAPTAAELRRLLPTQSWDLVVLDAMLPDAGLLDTLAFIRGAQPSVPVLVLTAAVELEFVLQAMKAGANGLVHKHRASQDLLAAVRQVAQGGSWLHPETAAEVAAVLRADSPLPHLVLSARELEIFKLIALGRAVKEIAHQLALSDKTVATYLMRIREKTGLQSHVEIARYALKHRLVD